MYFGLFVPVPGRERGERTFSSSRNKYGPFRLQISFSHLVHITYRCFIFLDAFAVSKKIKAQEESHGKSGAPYGRAFWVVPVHREEETGIHFLNNKILI